MNLPFVYSFHGKQQLKKELLEFFRFSENTPSASAFSQRRNKLLIDAFKYLFHEFNSRFDYHYNYKGYQLLACDGLDLNISLDPQNKDTYFQSQPTDRGYNQLHLNALFDLCNKRYVDVLFNQHERKMK